MSQFKQYLRESIQQVSLNEWAPPQQNRGGYLWPKLTDASHLNPKKPDLVMDPWGRGWLPRDHPDLGKPPTQKEHEQGFFDDSTNDPPYNPDEWSPNPDAPPASDYNPGPPPAPAEWQA